MRLGPPLRTASASAEVIHPMMEGGEGPRELAVCLRRARAGALGCAKGRARVCQGGTLLTGAPAAASGRGGGDLSECAVPATAEAQASAEQEPGARIVRRRQCHGMLLAGCGGWRPVSPSDRRRGRKKSTPPKGPRIYLGRTGYNPLSFKKKCPGSLPARRGCRATACTAPKTLSKRPALVRVCN